MPDYCYLFLCTSAHIEHQLEKLYTITSILLGIVMMGEMSNSVIDRCHFFSQIAEEMFSGATFEARHCVIFSMISGFLL